MSKWHKLRDRKFLEEPALKGRLCFLPKSCTRCSGFLSLHLVLDYVAKLAFIHTLVAVIDFIALPFINPTPTLPALCSLVAFLPGRAILWFTHSQAKLLCSVNFQCVRICVYACLCVYSLPHLPVQGLSLISSSCYHPQWVKAGLKDNLLAYSASWSALPRLHLSFK